MGLYEQLKGTGSEAEGRAVADQIWQIWIAAPDAQAQKMLDDGVQQLRFGNFPKAQSILTELIGYCPDYAEGWNQRAFARFLAGDFDGSLADLDRVMALEPGHFAALAGRGLALLRQGRVALAHKALRGAVALHPWLSERRLLPKGKKI